MNKKGMGLFSVVLLLLALTIGAAISAGDITPEKVEGIKGNFTIDELNISLDEGINQELGNALNYYANGLLNAYEELAKWVMTYAAEHPEIPYKLLFFLIIINEGSRPG